MRIRKDYFYFYRIWVWRHAITSIKWVWNSVLCPVLIRIYALETVFDTVWFYFLGELWSWKNSAVLKKIKAWISIKINNEKKEKQIENT